MERPLNGFSADPGGRLYAARVDFALVGASLRSRIESANWRICSESPGPVARSPREALGMHARSGRTVVPDLAPVFIAWRCQIKAGAGVLRGSSSMFALQPGRRRQHAPARTRWTEEQLV